MPVGAPGKPSARALLRVAASPSDLAEAAARLVERAARRCVRARGRFTLVLSGGTTPRATYVRLAQPPFLRRVPWEDTWVFFVDERCVPPGDPRSNYGMARSALLSKVPIPDAQVFRIRGEQGGPAAAGAYARAITRAVGTRPRFDLVLLGLGEDGHAASLFPGSAALEENALPVVPVPGAPPRVTLTLPVLNAAGSVLFLVSGRAKSRVLQAVLSGRSSLPAARIRPERGRQLWMVDRAAASRLSVR